MGSGINFRVIGFLKTGIGAHTKGRTVFTPEILYNIIAGYKREIAINPLIARNYLEVGKSYKNLGEWTEAEKWYDEYLKREEASSDELIRYSEILVKMKHSDEELKRSKLNKKGGL
jgi:tetratricopeptide (TPR) repeat protein